jgi:DNA-binding IclR family transcriptional regulator
VVAILGVLANAEGSVGIKDVATALGLPMSTSHRLLDLLVGQGIVQRDEQTRRYKIGVELFRLSSLISERHSIANFAEPILGRITQETGETSVLALYLPERDALIFAAKADSAQPLRYRLQLHVPLPLAWGATSLAVLAHLPQKERQRAIRSSGASPVSGQNIDERALEARLGEICKQGYAFSQNEKLPGATGLAVPVFSGHGAIRGCIAFTIPGVRYNPAQRDAFLRSLRQAARELSQAL